jgi:predicted Rossmann fold flavoprotein
MDRILVIGAGAAGLFAALTAARRGRTVVALEKMHHPALKLGLTGKGRCNLTNLCDVDEFIANVPGNGRFLRPAVYAFTPQDAVEFFGEIGVETKVERGRRVFPGSDDAPLVARSLANATRAAGARIRLHAPVAEILLAEGRAAGVRLGSGEELQASAVILATGGASYPATGSTGDGYRLARQCGHTVTDIRPSLVPLETQEDWPRQCQGLTLKNVELQAWSGSRSVYRELGELLCTHFGVSGPLVLTASRHLVDVASPRLTLDLKPGLSPEQLDARLQRDLVAGGNRQLKNIMGGLLPQRLIPMILDLADMDPALPCHSVTKAQRRRLGQTLKRLELHVTKPRPIAEAVITAGGVSTREINPGTMESRLVPGLFFAGEVIDVDGYTGGFNLHIAWATGRLAGTNA